MEKRRGRQKNCENNNKEKQKRFFVTWKPRTCHSKVLLFRRKNVLSAEVWKTFFEFGMNIDRSFSAEQEVRIEKERRKRGRKI